MLAGFLVVGLSITAFATSYDSAVLADLPVHYWTGNSTTSDSGGGTSLFWTGSATYSGPTGITGQANGFNFTGANYLTATIGVWTSQSYTIEFWIQSNSAAGRTIAISNSSGAGSRYYILVNCSLTSCTIHDKGDSAGVGNDYGYVVAMAGGAWHLVDFTCDTLGVARGYVDGTLNATSSCNTTGAWQSADYVTVGGWLRPGWIGGGPDYDQGQRSSYALYSGPLASGRIAAHFSAAAGGTPSTLSVTPTYAGVVTGHSQLFNFQATDSTGAAISPGTVTLVGTSPSGGLGSCAPGGGGVVCTAGATGIYTAQWTNGTLTTASTVFVFGTASRFQVIPTVVHVNTAQKGAFHNASFDASGTDISTVDGFDISGSPPAGVLCDAKVTDGQGRQTVACFSSTPGTYTLTFADAAGLTATAQLVVATASNPGGCSSTDVGCWLTNLWGAITSLPGEIAGAFVGFFFNSPSGKNYIDLSQLLAVPYIACRSGEVPTAPDHVHCWPFPFAVPAQLGVIFGVINTAPTSPVLDMHVHVPPIDQHVAIDPTTSVLTPTVMGWVRGVEYVLFLASLGMAVRKYIQAFGVS
jgi:hypothetical protein